MKKLFIGKLDIRVNEDELRDLFGMHGEVDEVNDVRDTYSGRSRRFGFVEMSSCDDADRAIAALHGVEHRGRILTVARLQPPTITNYGSLC